MEVMSDMRRGDPELDAIRGIFEEWEKSIGLDQYAFVRDVIALVTRPSTGDSESSENVGLRDAVMMVARGKDGEISGVRLGHWLRGVKGRVVGGRKMIDDGGTRGLRWILTKG